jgi:putative tricarboxylic transport membrane protein
MALCRSGVYGNGRSSFDLALLFFFGLVGYFFRRFDFPAAPLIIGLILGPIAEQSLRQAMIIGMGEWSTFVTRPISASILFVAFLLFFSPFLINFYSKRKKTR